MTFKKGRSTVKLIASLVAMLGPVTALWGNPPPCNINPLGNCESPHLVTDCYLVNSPYYAAHPVNYSYKPSHLDAGARLSFFTDMSPDSPDCSDSLGNAPNPYHFPDKDPGGNDKIYGCGACNWIVRCNAWTGGVCSGWAQQCIGAGCTTHKDCTALDS